MRTCLPVILVAVYIVACTPNPRYGGESGPRPDKPRSTAPTPLSTNEKLHLGQIIRGYLGKPYAGRSKYEAGLDCSAFTRDVFRDFNGTTLPRTVREQFEEGVRLDRRDLAFGDLVFFRTDGKLVSHAGIYVGFDEFVHVSTSLGVTRSSLSEKYWSKSFVGARRVIGLKSGDSR